MMEQDDKRGLTVIFTGDGKGKTSAALGVIFRSLGHGSRCRMIQFIKGRIKSGELYLAERMGPELEITQVGLGYTWTEGITREEHMKAAEQGLELARTALVSGDYRTVVLDEVLYALKAGLVSVEHVEKLIDSRPKTVHLVLTGRGAPQRLIDKADMVTSMEMIKHPKQKGIPALKCLDY